MQVVALGMLAVAPQAWLVVPYVMAAQALSGIAKDLTKMSSKSAVKLVVPADAPARSSGGSRSSPGRRTPSRASASSSAACC